MLSDLNRVDFNNVHEQASWVCNPCTSEMVREIEVRHSIKNNIISNNIIINISIIVNTKIL